MPVKIRCSNPNCGQILTCPDNSAGRKTRCPKCQTAMLIPAEAAPALTPQPEPAPSAAAAQASQTATDFFAPQQGAASSRRLGNYTINRKVGEGGMGAVYEAVQDGINRRVALKVLPKRLMANEAYVERFRREAQAAGVLNHPNIVTVYEFGQDKGHLFFSMEFVEGDTVFKRLKQGQRFAVQDALVIVTSLAQALEYAWNHGRIVHRDIKPENVMITPEGYVKLADLGLAKATGGITITVEGAGIGTPAYMAPEQGRGARDVDCRADIYSLGITLYHMVTGKLPFDGETPLAVMMAHAEQPLPDPRQYNASIPDNLCQLMKKMCAKKPEDRYQTPTELLGDISNVSAGRPIRAAAGAPDAEAHIQTIDSAAVDAPGAGSSRKASHTRRSRVPRRRSTAKSFLVSFAITIPFVLGAGAYMYWDLLLYQLKGPPVVEVTTTVPTTVVPDTPPAPTQELGQPPAPGELVKGLESKIDEMLKRLAYAEAVALIKTTSEGASDADRESLDKAQKRVIEHALKQFEKDKTKATVLLADDRFDDALGVMKASVRYGIDAVTEEATSEIERITALKTQAEPKTETVAGTGPGEKPKPPVPQDQFHARVKTFGGLRDRLQKDLSDLNYGRVLPVLDVLVNKPANVEFKQDLLGIKDDIKAVQALWQDFLKRMADSKGKQVSFGVKTGEIVEVKDDVIVLKNEDERQTVAFEDMQPSWLRAEMGIEAGDAARMYALGAFYLHKGRDAEAKAILDKLDGSQPAVQRLSRWLQLEQEAEAVEAVKAIQAASEAGDNAKTVALVAKFQEKYGATETARQEKSSLDQMKGAAVVTKPEVRPGPDASADDVEGALRTAENALDDWYEKKKAEVQAKYDEDMMERTSYRQDSFTPYDYYTNTYSSRGAKKTDNLEVIRRCLKALPKVTTTYYYYSTTSYYQQKKKFLEGEEKRLVREIDQANRRGKDNAEKLKNLYQKRKRDLHDRGVRLARKAKEGGAVSEKDIRDELYFWE